MKIKPWINDDGKIKNVTKNAKKKLLLPPPIALHPVNQQPVHLSLSSPARFLHAHTSYRTSKIDLYIAIEAFYMDLFT